MIKTAIKYLSAITVGFTIFLACEPCDDCGPENSYPYFNLSILNKTSLDTLQQYQTRLTKELKNVEEALDNPENTPIVDSLNNLKTIKSDSLIAIKALIKTTNQKKISIESINGETDLFRNNLGGDSLSKFKIPISTLESESEYIFKIEFADTTHNLKIKYQLMDTIINRKITKSAKNLQVIDHQFDSLRGPFGCKPIEECISNELEIYVEI